jgi:hypothetical protein
MTVIEVPTHIQLKNILFTTDFSACATSSALYAAQLAKHYRAKLYAFHAHPPLLVPMTPPESWPRLEEAARVAINQQKQQLLAAFPGIQPDVSICEGDLWSNLKAAIDEHNIEWLARSCNTSANGYGSQGRF